MCMHLTAQGWCLVTSSHLHLIQGTMPPESIAHCLMLWGALFFFSYLFTWVLLPKIPILKLVHELYLLSISPARVLALSCWISVEFPYWNVAKRFSVTMLQKISFKLTQYHSSQMQNFHITQNSFWAWKINPIFENGEQFDNRFFGQKRSQSKYYNTYEQAVAREKKWLASL